MNRPWKRGFRTIEFWERLFLSTLIVYHMLLVAKGNQRTMFSRFLFPFLVVSLEGRKGFGNWSREDEGRQTRFRSGSFCCFNTSLVKKQTQPYQFYRCYWKDAFNLKNLYSHSRKKGEEFFTKNIWTRRSLFEANIWEKSCICKWCSVIRHLKMFWFCILLCIPYDWKEEGEEEDFHEEQTRYAWLDRLTFSSLVSFSLMIFRSFLPPPLLSILSLLNCDECMCYDVYTYYSIHTVQSRSQNKGSRDIVVSKNAGEKEVARLLKREKTRSTPELNLLVKYDHLFFPS